jgi:DNA-binding NtrC family response regulator
MTDLNLPDVNRFELVTIISRKYPKLRVIAVSAYGSSDTLESAKIMGAAGVLAKPISPDERDEIVERVRKARETNA